MRMVPDLDRKNFAALQIPERAVCVIAAPFLHFIERSNDRSPGIEKGRSLPAPCKSLAPRGEQWIVGFRHLRPARFAATFPALFL
jgi:hypothetical protein